MNSTPANLHDAELYALRHDPSSRTVHCAFRTEEGNDVELVLSDVLKFRCTDFGLQNVVYQVIDSKSQSLEPDDIRQYVGWLCASSEGESLAPAGEIEELIHEVTDGRSRCVLIIPSWGSQVGAIARQLEWH